MFVCIVCDKSFEFQCRLDRHISRNRTCQETSKKINEIEKSREELARSLEKRNEKYSRLKAATRVIVDEKDELSQKFDELLKKLEVMSKENEELKRKQETLGLSHRAELAEAKYHTSKEKDQVIMEAVKNKNGNNKTIINNNTVVIQDFSIKQVNEYNADMEELTDVIYMKSVSEACRHMLEKYYWTLPPNIKVADQARKKILIVKDNQWVQESMKELAHQLYHKSFKKIAMKCIREKIDEHKDFLSNPLNMRKYDEQERHREEIMKWEGIEHTWDYFDSQELHNPMMISIKNLTETELIKV